MFTPYPRASFVILLAEGQDTSCGMHIPECSSTHMHTESPSLRFSTYVMCFYVLLYATLVSGLTKLLHVIWQTARQLFLKDVNLETIW